MAKIQLDFTVDFKKPSEVAELKSELRAHNLLFEVLTERGPAGGHPVIELTGKRSDIEKYLEVYCAGDKEQASELIPMIEKE